MNFANNHKITVVSNAVAAGTTDIDPTAIDMDGFDSVCFIVQFGAIVAGAVTSVKAQQSSDDGNADAFADLAGTAQTVADDDDNKAFVIDIHRPSERYVKPYIVRGTQNATVESVVAIQYCARNAPVTQPASIGGVETHNSPAEGTA